MAKYETKPINSLLTLNKDSVNSDFDLNKLRAVFDSNYEKWKSLSPGDPQRCELANKNEEIIKIILEIR